MEELEVFRVWSEASPAGSDRMNKMAKWSNPRADRGRYAIFVVIRMALSNSRFYFCNKDPREFPDLVRTLQRGYRAASRSDRTIGYR